MERELLRKLGEETLYSAKGHFKACDLRRNLVTLTIWICVLFSILDIMNIVSNDLWFDAITLFGAIGLLIWNEGEGKDYRTTHKKIGEKYLAIHKEIRACYLLAESDKAEVQELSERISKLDKSDKPDIPWLARKWAQRAIQKHQETDNWFEE